MLPLRIFRSFHAKYYADDILTGPEAYPEEYFAELVEHGFNAVWLRGILRDLATSDIFPTLGTEIARHQDALGTVVERAKRHGVQVLLYLNEPLCLPAEHPFWTEHPEARGVRGESSMDEWYDTNAFCTSTPSVRDWLREASERVFRAIPELGGWFLISASEHHTHCYSHVWDVPGGKRPECPRCAARAATEVVAELITALRDGTRAASPHAHTIAWNWSWAQFEADPQPSLLARLPKDVPVMLDWERGGYRQMPDGKKIFVDEYSLGYVGPSERFMAGYQAAREHDLPVMAKLQVGTTHELATVPNLPLVDNLYEKLCGVERLGLTGMLATWNFGNSLTLNTAAVGEFVRSTERPAPTAFVSRLAAAYCPGADGEKVAAAVHCFSTAMLAFPFDMWLVYFGPQNYALAYPLTLEPLTGKSMGRTWVMDERGDNLNQALGQFTLDEVIGYFTQLSREWQQAVALLEEGLASSAHPHATQELRNVQVIGCCFRSTANIYRNYRLRLERPADADAQFQVLVADEIANLEVALPLIEADPRLGFHAECQAYQFTPALVREKLAQLWTAGFHPANTGRLEAGAL